MEGTTTRIMPATRTVFIGPAEEASILAFLISATIAPGEEEQSGRADAAMLNEIADQVTATEGVRLGKVAAATDLRKRGPERGRRFVISGVPTGSTPPLAKRGAGPTGAIADARSRADSLAALRKQAPSQVDAATVEQARMDADAMAAMRDLRQTT